MTEPTVKVSSSPEAKMAAKLEPTDRKCIDLSHTDAPQDAVASTSHAGGPSNGSQDDDYLTSLSVAQRNAVTAPPDEPLQILAGPGSGKTRVLVSRVTWLVLHQRIDPRDLFVVTFTNKAANEMRNRLNKLIGPMRTSQLVIGTFHATCAKFLRRFAQLVGIGNNFSICDADESKRVFKAILKEKAEELKSNDGSVLRPELCMAEISRAKAKNLSPLEYSASLDEKQAEQTASGRRPESMAIRRIVAKVYEYYADHLTRNNALDFDDLLVYGVKLFANNARVIANFRHVLVDEFQDVNTAQYLLMSHLAGRGGSRGAVSIVGDPDQSIYGWRSAEVGNLDKMVDEFAAWSSNGQVRRVFLEENYRSTAHILQAAKAIIEASSSRIDRGLYTSHAKGPPVVLKQFTSSRPEANFIATEIKRVIAHSGGLLTYDDFAILLRYNALSREVEQQLMTESIPSRIMGGARFFERKEVKDLLAYMMLADNPGFTPALSRVINVPKRAIGDKSVKDLHALAEAEGVPTMTIVERVADSPRPILGVKPMVQNNLRQFVEVIRQIRRMAEENDSVANIINKAMESIGYEAHLKKEPDFEQRWENVKELISFSKVIALDVEENANMQRLEDGATEDGTVTPTLLTQLRKITSSSQAPSSMPSSQAPSRAPRSSQVNVKGSSDVIDLLTTDEEDSEVEVKASKKKGKKPVKKEIAAKTEPSVKADLDDVAVDSEAEELADEDKTHLRVFLEACTLSTDMEEKTEDNTAKTPKVTIATAHAAKGLEFPVVFVLSVEEGTYPFYRSSGSTEEIDEETRLLYVAVTRAQAMAYMTYCSYRYVNGDEQSKTLSRFVSRIAETGKYPGGQWRPQAATTEAVQPGGFVRAPGYEIIKPAPKKVDFGKKRPDIGPSERRVFAKVLGRPMPSEAEAEKARVKFDESDAGSRIKRMDGGEGASHYSGYPSSGNSPFGNAAFARSAASLFAMKDESASELKPTIQTASSLMSGFGRGASNGSSNRQAPSAGSFGKSATFGNASGQRFSTAAAASSAAASLGGGGRYPPSITSANRAPHPHSALAHLATFNGAAPTGKRLGMGRAPSTLPSTKKPRQS